MKPLPILLLLLMAMACMAGEQLSGNPVEQRHLRIAVAVFASSALAGLLLLA